jgi:hypothetical protein
MSKQTFETELMMGHKGAAVIVPFDPAELWRVEPVQVPSAEYGERPGFLVAASIEGFRFDGWIGSRWGRFFMIVSPQVRKAAKVSVGDVVHVEVTPRGSSAAPKIGAKKIRARRKKSAKRS